MVIAQTSVAIQEQRALQERNRLRFEQEKQFVARLQDKGITWCD